MLDFNQVNNQTIANCLEDLVTEAQNAVNGEALELRIAAGTPNTLISILLRALANEVDRASVLTCTQREDFLKTHQEWVSKFKEAIDMLMPGIGSGASTGLDPLADFYKSAGLEPFDDDDED